MINGRIDLKSHPEYSIKRERERERRWKKKREVEKLRVKMRSPNRRIV